MSKPISEIIFFLEGSKQIAEDDIGSAISSGADREADLDGEETETAPEGEGDDDDSITRCIWYKFNFSLIAS